MDEFDQKLEISEESGEEIVEKIPGRDVYETISLSCVRTFSSLIHLRNM